MDVFFKLLCKISGHSYCLRNRSNVIQFDTMGNPLRLFIVKCDRCGKSKMMWIDTAESKKDVVLKWSDEYESGVPIPPSTNEEKYVNKLQDRVNKLQEENW